MMAIVLASLGVACLLTGVCLAKKELANEQKERDQVAKQYAEIFRADQPKSSSNTGSEVELNAINT